MEDSYCPNYNTCKLVTIAGFAGDEQRRQQYIEAYCNIGETRWKTCTRYIAKEALNFCPDFVFPDTDLSPDEIIDKFDELNQ